MWHRSTVAKGMPVIAIDHHHHHHHHHLLLLSLT
jgi:hypothetical protein